MKKVEATERTVCDFCEEGKEQPGWAQCLVCGKDLCRDHRLELTVYVSREDQRFRASLCPIDARPLLPVLEGYKGRSQTWQQAGQNVGFNEAQLEKIIARICSAEGGETSDSVRPG